LVALRAEPEEADAEEVEAEVVEPRAPVGTYESVIDGPVSETFNTYYKGEEYEVSRKDWTFKKLEGDLATGDWNKAFTMPEAAFKKNEKSLRQRWRSKKRKLRIYHGMGQKWPNGKYIFLTKLQGSIFTRQQYGENYVGHAQWHYSPNEMARRERQTRAAALKRELEQQAEETRVARMKELNVGLGKESWRRPWQAKVDYFPPDRTSRKKAPDFKSAADAAEMAAEAMNKAQSTTKGS